MSEESAGLGVPTMVVPAHNLARWIHARLGITDGIMRWDLPRTLFGIIPLGHRRIEIPASSVERVHVKRVIRPIDLTMGLAAMISPFLVGSAWWGLLTFPIGLWIVLVSLGPRMEAEDNTGRKWRVDVCFGHQIDADLYIAAVEDIGAEARRLQASSPPSSIKGSAQAGSTKGTIQDSRL